MGVLIWTNGKLWVSAFVIFCVNSGLTALSPAAQIKKRVPMAQKHIEKVRDLFQRYDSNGNDSLDMNELALLLQEISSKITTLPAVSHCEGTSI
jgi:hypothetical protein